MQVCNSAAWTQVPSVLRCAFTTLAETSKSMSQRIASLEHELESERLRASDAHSQLVHRVESLEEPRGEDASTLPATNAGCGVEWRLETAELWRTMEAKCRDLEQRFMTQLDAARADAAATRAVVTAQKSNDENLTASVAAAIDDAAPLVLPRLFLAFNWSDSFLRRIAAEASEIFLRDYRPRLLANDDLEGLRDSKQRGETRDYDEVMQIAIDALATANRVQNEIISRPSRQECNVIADDAAARRVAPLVADIAATRRRLKTNSHLEQEAHMVALGALNDGGGSNPRHSAGDGHSGVPSHGAHASRRIETANQSDAAWYSYGPSTLGRFPLTMAQAVEGRCNEVVSTLNRKAYSSDVSRAFDSINREIRREIKESEASMRSFVRRSLDTLPTPPALTHGPVALSTDQNAKQFADSSASRGASLENMLSEIRELRENSVATAASVDVNRKLFTEFTSRLDSLEAQQRASTSAQEKLMSDVRAARRAQQSFHRARDNALEKLETKLSKAHRLHVRGSDSAALKCDGDTIAKCKEAVESAARDLRNQLDAIVGSANEKTREMVTETASKIDKVQFELETMIEDRFRRCEPTVRCGRWLWRSGRAARGGWVPWDLEAVNSARESISWQKHNPTRIVASIAGLYRVTVGFFTHADCTIQLCVGGEPVLTLEPDPPNTTVSKRTEPLNPCCFALSHALRRTAHSAGEVACVSIDDYVALPAQAELAVRFNFGLDARDASCQAFFSIVKL